ncbi:hypothetical protein [Pseudaestuariivita rosea]|uniref:hypothetical protein n=1 Tax=Pseudaestuariivita rosea TaxID=2763263 RepID=UPI001ABB22DD|nr:hypothetical protein [Pseudaestuariivita rosea]
MKIVAQGPFPGWRDGSGRRMACMNMTAYQLGTLLGLETHTDNEDQYLWFDRTSIGRMTVITDARNDFDFAEVYVERHANRLEAFKEIIAMFIEVLPDDVPCQLEDEIDYDRSYRLIHGYPLEGPLQK